MRVLLLDEYDDFYLTLTAILQDSTIDIDHYPHTNYAEYFTQHTSYELILVEIFRQHYCNLEIISHLKLLNPAAMIIVTTYKPSISTAVIAIKLGAENYFPKYVAPERWIHTYTTAEPVTPPHSIDELKWQHMRSVLKKTRGNITAAAKKLGITRRTLHRKINKYLKSNQLIHD